MKKNTLLLFVGIGATLALVAVLYLMFMSKDTGEQYTESRIIRYKFTVQNKGSTVIPKAEFWALTPVKQTAFQVVREIKTSLPYELTTDELGNQKMHFVIEGLAPYASKIVSVDVRLSVAKSPNDTEENLARFTQPERFIESKAPEIVALAEELAGENSLKTLRNIYNWVSTTLGNTGYLAEDKGALYALQNKKGDCTEHAYLYAALARANGIPARVLSGYVHGQSAYLQAKEYHNWVEVHVNNRWRVVDTDKKQFMENENHYISSYIVSSDASENLDSAQRFFGTSMKSIQVRME